MAVEYEWDVELQAAVDSDDHEEGEVLDHDHQLSYADAMKRAAMPTPDGFRSVIVLVRDDDAGRSWAYVENGKLAEKFSDANGSDVAKVPACFAKEVEKAALAAKLYLTLGRTYRGKKPKACGSMFKPMVDDRTIVYMSALADIVQYDGPGVPIGRRLPKTTFAKFQKWASRDVTDELPKGEYAPWPIDGRIS